MESINKNNENHDLGKQTANHFPPRISEYLENNFEKSFISDIKKLKDKHGEVFYHVNISHDNSLYRLKFNDEGVMVLSEAEPLLELDDNEYEIVD